MDRNRPTGRKKRFGLGTGGVKRREQAGQTGGPVGNEGGYADRPQTPPPSAPQTPPPSATPPPGPGGGSGLGGDETPPGDLGDLGPGGSGRGAGGTGTGRSGLGNLGNRLPTRVGSSGCGCGPKLVLLLLVLAVIAVVLWLLLRGCGSMVWIPPSDGGGLGGSGTTPPVYTDTGPDEVDTGVATSARAKRTVIRGGGQDTVTLMIYMCGTDLESRSGMATADIQEMVRAQISDKVNVILETGGAAQWRNDVISNQTNQRYKVVTGGLQPLNQDLGRRSMTDPATLADFIQFCRTNFPADRYELIFWDHGAGSLAGYGYDEFFPGTMTLDEIDTALRAGGTTFDFIGFDACLMATLETLLVTERYADYQISSEEVEPGIGWYYTDWLTALSQNTSMPTTELGKILIDSYANAVAAQEPRSQITLSLIDLAELAGTVPSAFDAFSKTTNGLIVGDQFATVSTARAGSKQFATSVGMNQVDLVDFAERIGTNEARRLAEVLRDTVKYNRTSPSVANAHGISIFFPSGRMAQLDSMLQTYQAIGIDEDYSTVLRSFANLAAGGQMVAPGAGNLLDMLLGGQPAASGGSSSMLGSLLQSFLGTGDFSRVTGTAEAPTWLNTGQIQQALEYYAEHQFDSSKLALTEKNGERVISLPEDQWQLVQNLEQNVFLDDGRGFIDLGLDNVYDFNGDGDLIMEYDGTWLALNGQPVAYYFLSQDPPGAEESTIVGRVPALLNDRLVDIMIQFDAERPEGSVMGARIRYETPDGPTLPKGLVPIDPGDKIDFLCDFYTYEGRYQASFKLGDQVIATTPATEWEVANVPVGDLSYQMTYRLTDIYGNQFWTQPVTSARPAAGTQPQTATARSAAAQTPSTQPVATRPLGAVPVP